MSPVSQSWRVLFTKAFYHDFRRLSDSAARNARGAIDDVIANGPYYASLQTRKVQRNPDDRFRLMDVDDDGRIVACIDERTVLFMRVGNHDRVIKLAEGASLSRYGGIVNPEAHSTDLPTASERPAKAPRSPTLEELVAALPLLSEDITEEPPDYLEGYRNGTIEDWMVFLSPLQRHTAYRTASGPARVTGGPGTGKTVVALHRTAHLVGALGGGAEILG